MIDGLVWCAAGLLLVVTLQLLRNLAAIEVLADLEPEVPAEFPSLSIVVPACNEERGVEAAIGRMVAADYPDLQIIAIDDRSTDRTGELLDALAVERPRLRVEHVSELPAGWLGKVHALERGRCLASGELLLFMDGDVQLQPGALRRAVAVLIEQELDHVSFIPAASAGTPLCQILLNSAIHALMTFVPGKRASDPTAPVGVGSGCFNMVRASALEEVGGFEPIRLEIIDDGALAYRIGRAGFRSRCFSGRDSVHVEWYADVGDLMRGFEKNAFSGVGYSLPVALGLVAFAASFWFCAFVLPWFSRSPWALAMLLGSQIAYGAALMVESRRLGFPRWADLFYPLGSFLMPFVLLRSAVMCSARGAVYWRGTRYSLRELRAGQTMNLNALQWMRFGSSDPPVTD